MRHFAVAAFTALCASSIAQFEPIRVGSSYGATYYYEFWNGGRNPIQDPATFPHISAMGAGWTRIDFNRWQAMRAGPTPFQTEARPFLQAALDSGLKVVIVLIDDKPPIGEEQLAAWKAFLTAAVTEFRTESEAGKIVWEVWNEPTNKEFWGGVEESGWVRANAYMPILQAAHVAIRTISPNALISGPANGWGSDKEKAFYLRCRDLGLETLVDYVSVHPSKLGDKPAAPGYPMQEPESIWGRDTYPFSGRWSGTPWTLKDLRRYLPNRPLIITEWPFGANPSTSEYSSLSPYLNQTALSWRALLVSMADGIPIHLQWEFQEESAPPGDPGWFPNMGIRDLSGNPRPVYFDLGDFLRNYKNWFPVVMPSSVADSAIIIDAPGKYRLVLESPTGTRRILRWGAAPYTNGQTDANYPEMPILMPAISSVTPLRSTLYGGINPITVRATGRDTLSASVQMSDDSTLVSTPPYVNMPAGQDQVTFDLYCPKSATAQVITLTAKMNQSTANCSFTIHPIPAHTLTFPLTLIDGGHGFGARVSINPTSPISTEVNFSDNSAALNSPATAIIPTGASFRDAYVQTNEVSATTSATLTATIFTVSKAKTITIRPKPLLTALAFASSTYPSGNISGTVRLSSANIGGSQTVELSDNSSLVTTPTGAVVADGMSAKTFVMTAAQSASTYSVTVTAKLGAVTKTVALTITP